MALTLKQERFCQKYIELGNASEAYRQSYDCKNSAEATINNEAYVLLKNPDIAARIDEYRAEERQEHSVTIASITNEYEEVRRKAIRSGDYSPAVSAITGKAKLHGLIIDKSNIVDKEGKLTDPVKMVVVAAENIKNELNKLNEEF